MASLGGDTVQEGPRSLYWAPRDSDTGKFDERGGCVGSVLSGHFGGLCGWQLNSHVWFVSPGELRCVCVAGLSGHVAVIPTDQIYACGKLVWPRCLVALVSVTACLTASWTREPGPVDRQAEYLCEQL